MQILVQNNRGYLNQILVHNNRGHLSQIFGS